MIKIFDSTDTEFDTLGLGVLNDAIKCIVSEERNGSFELEMEYPIDGIHYDDIKLRNIIVTKSNPFSNEQAFRIYYMSKPINGIVTINAEHISYDMSGIVVSPFKASNIESAFKGLKDNSTPACPFEFFTDKTVTTAFEVKVPSSLRSLLGGTEGSILDIYGTGEYEFSNYKVTFNTHRGLDRGVTIRYGKNLTDITQEENCSKVYTAVYPYWAGTQYNDGDSKDILITIPEKTVPVSGTFNFLRVYPLDLGSVFNEQPSVQQLRDEAKKYIDQNGIGKPEVSLKVSFVQLEQAEEYEQLKLLESVYLCDTVTVIFEALGVDSTAKCIKTEYNAITDKYESLEFGDSRTNLANTIVNQSNEIANVPTLSSMEQEILKATKLITGGLGGYVMLNSSTGQLQPDEILILGEESEGYIAKAENVWRFNMAGLGFSSTGYNGPYKSIALTVDGDDKGTVIADKVKAEGIQAGTIDGVTITGSEFISQEIDPADGKTVLSETRIAGGHLYTSNIDVDCDINMHTTHALYTPNIYCSKDSPSYAKYIDVRDDIRIGYDQHGNVMNVHMAFAHSPHIKKNDDYPIEEYKGGLNWGTTDWCVKWQQRSDRRLKENFKELTKDKVKKFFSLLKPISFNFKTDKSKTLFGVVAQDMQDIMQEIGYDNSNFVLHSSKSDILGVDYEQFHAWEIRAIQDLYEKIDMLEEQLREEIK